MRQVGCLPELNGDARSEKYSKTGIIITLCIMCSVFKNYAIFQAVCVCVFPVKMTVNADVYPAKHYAFLFLVRILSVCDAAEPVN